MGVHEWAKRENGWSCGMGHIWWELAMGGHVWTWVYIGEPGMDIMGGPVTKGMGYMWLRLDMVEHN